MEQYEQDLYIDESALDVEWLNQPQLMMKYTVVQADARRKVDQAKENLGMVRAELDKEIRSDPDAYKIEKISNPVVEAIVILQPKYKTAIKELIDTQYEFEISKGVVQAVDQRKSALENLVKLHGQQYFAGPKVPRDFHGEVEKFEEKKRKSNNSKIKIGMKRRA